jgi:hypothetical protein
MKNLSTLIILCLFTVITFAQKPLFNGKDLKNWEVFMGSAITGFEDQAKLATPAKTFSVVKMEKQKVIRVSGELNASLATKESYGNYHLHLEFKWGEKVYGKQNSGLLYHSYGPFGVAFGTWMACIEHQLMHENLGDTYLMGNTGCQTKAKMGNFGTAYFYAPDGQLSTFSEETNGRSVKKKEDAEKPLGEWNTVDLYCFGQTSVHVVNGKVVMVNTNCYKNENGQTVPLTEGRIQIQSEGGEFYIRKIEISDITEIPAEILK